MAKSKDRLIWGIVLSVVGLLMIFPGRMMGIPSNTSLIFGLPLLAIGIIIILNKSEDKIEKRKDLNQNN